MPEESAPINFPVCLHRRQRLVIAIATVTLCCWSPQAFAQTRPSAPSNLRIPQDEDALRRARAAAAAAAAQPNRLSFSLSVNQNDLYVNEVVTVTLNPIDTVRKSPFLFTVDFGDGEKRVLDQVAQVQHQYRTAGSYTISASVSIRPNITRTFDGIPRFGNTVSITVRKTVFSATPAVAAAGEALTFSTPARRGDSRVRYRFTFGDGDATGWIADVQTTHAYKNAGAYGPTMEVGIFDDNENRMWDKSEPVSIRIADVTLDAPTSLTTDQEGRFTVQFPETDAALRFRVNFADNSAPSEWSANPTVTHTYAAGRYQPFGELGRMSDVGVTRVAASARRDLAVRLAAATVVIPVPQPPVGGGGGGGGGGGRGRQSGRPFWLLYAAIALSVAALGYGAKQMFFAPRPTFTPHRGQSDSQIESADGGVALQLEVRLHPDADAAQTTLNAPSGRLIDSETV